MTGWTPASAAPEVIDLHGSFQPVTDVEGVTEGSWAEDGPWRERVWALMAAHWRPGGFAVPHASDYPWQWLWDSCFHALIWAELGERERAVSELQSALADQDRLGFVPHIRYVDAPEVLSDFWGRRRTSSITQPPMYGHAVAALVRRGIDVPAAVLDGARAGLAFLLDRRARTQGALVTAVHPWETGCDDSPRWDHWCGPAGWSTSRWYDVKGALLKSIQRVPPGSPLANPAFACGPVGFNALVAWNAGELASVTGDRALAVSGQALAAAVDARWDADLVTWVDDGPSAATSGRVRTLDSLLPALVCASTERAAEALASALDDGAYGGPFGPACVHRQEPAFDPSAYWRGSAWPPITYLLWCAARRHGLTEAAHGLAQRLGAGARASDLAEHWHPDTGGALGAVPQSWAGLAVCTVNS